MIILTYAQLAKRVRSHHNVIKKIVIDKYGELPEIDQDIWDYVVRRFEENRPKKGNNKSMGNYVKAYEAMNKKGYMSFAELRERFSNINYEQIKCNFDNAGCLVYDDTMPSLKYMRSKTRKYLDCYTFLPILRPCKDLKGNWIA